MAKAAVHALVFVPYHLSRGLQTNDRVPMGTNQRLPSWMESCPSTIKESL